MSILFVKKMLNLPLTKSERAILRMAEMALVTGLLAGLSALELAVMDLSGGGAVTWQDVRYAAIFVLGTAAAGTLGALLKFLPSAPAPVSTAAPIISPVIQQIEASSQAAATAAQHSLERNDVVQQPAPATVPHG